MSTFKFMITCLLIYMASMVSAQMHPEIYIRNVDKDNLLSRMNSSKRASLFVADIKNHVDPYVVRHISDPEWIVSRLQMYWETKYKRIYVNGMDFSYGEGEAPVPTVRFSGSRDWATDYLQPELEDVKPYMDDPRGLYLQNGKNAGQPWEWVQPSETGHIIERINEEIMKLAEEAAFLYWLTEDDKYAVFAHDIFMKYTAGMYYRDPPLTTGDHKNALLMGLQTFEVIHERIVEHLTICYDFLYGYLKNNGANLAMIQSVFQKWADQEIKYGVPGNNWNLMQALYITYLALALENDEYYENGKGQEYYIDQVLNQNSEKQKALRDVVKNYDQETGVWPEVAGYNMLVANDMLEIFTLMDNTLDNNLVAKYPIIEKANLVIFQYLFPNGFTVAYGDAKHSRMRFNALELLLSNYQKYNLKEKENLITAQLKKFMADGAYSRDKISSLFQLFFYVEDFSDVPAATSFSDLVSPTFYAPNVSWIVHRNGNDKANGMMISKNASLGNHSHTNGINIELYARGMVIAPDGAAGVSYWSRDHIDYYSRFPAHNTVVVDGISDYRNMRGSQSFDVNAIYPSKDSPNPLIGDYTFSDVIFTEPSTDATQQRLTGTVRTSPYSGYFIDIFRSSRNDGKDKKHEYLFHGQGDPIQLTDFSGKYLELNETDELSSKNGDLKGYDYFKNKKESIHSSDFKAQFSMPSVFNTELKVNLWMKGYADRRIFTVKAPYSRAIHQESVTEQLYHKPLPTLIVRQNGEAGSRPFVSIIDAFNAGEDNHVKEVAYFSPNDGDSDFVGLQVKSKNRIDFIFNAVKDQKTHVFMGGHFRGTYGVISYLTDNSRSMLLGSGSKLAGASWSIESVEDNGTVFIKYHEDELLIDAKQPFKLTIPLPKKTRKAVLEFVNENKIQIVEGKVDKKKKHVEFELPILTNCTAEIKYK